MAAGTKFTYRIWSRGAEISGVEGLTPVQLSVPATVDGLEVCGIGAEAFSGDLFVTAVLLAHGIEYVGPGAFRGCPYLRSVRLPATLKRVDEGAFCDCAALKSVFLEGDCVPKGLALGEGVVLRGPGASGGGVPSGGATACYAAVDGAPRKIGGIPEELGGIERAVAVVRQAASVGGQVRDREALRCIYDDPMVILQCVMDDVRAVDVLVRTVEGMPDIGRRFELLTLMAATCSVDGLPEQATIALAAAARQSGVDKVAKRNGESWLML